MKGGNALVGASRKEKLWETGEGTKTLQEKRCGVCGVGSQSGGSGLSNVVGWVRGGDRLKGKKIRRQRTGTDL